MSDTLFNMSQYNSGATQSYSPDWKDATGPDPAWDEPDSEPNSKTSTQEPAGDALTEWQIKSEFTITLKSGQIIDVKFVPGQIGELSMHQFDFTGSISPTGFKSHFVLAVEAEQFTHPRNYAQAYAQELVRAHESKTETRGKKRTHSKKAAPAPQSPTVEQDDSTLLPAMAADKTTELNHATVEVVEELSPEEEADRQRLELKVERAFYDAGKALVELRSRRLYRSTHSTFETYCRERFGFTRQNANYFIAGASVVDNLLGLTTNCCQILPTKESQVRPLTSLNPKEQVQVWHSAVDQADGKVPSARIVKDAVLRHKGIVERLNEKNPSPPELAAGDVIEIKARKRSHLHPFNAMWGTIEHVGSSSYTVRVNITKDLQQCKGEDMVRIDDEYTANIKAVGQRIAALVKFELEPVEYAILEVLQRSKCFTPRQLLYLERMESDYGLQGNDN